MRLRSREVSRSKSKYRNLSERKPERAQVVRTTKERICQDLAKSYRTHPVLVENLLSAHYLAKRKKATFCLSTRAIQSVLNWVKATRWLCPWGYGDYRWEQSTINFDFPDDIQEKYDEMRYEEPVFERSRSKRADSRKSPEELRRSMMRADEHLAAILLYKIDFSRITLLRYLPRHTCSELYLDHCVIPEEGFHDIARCQNIQALSLERSKFDCAWLGLLSSLPNLKKLNVRGCTVNDDALDVLSSFPRLHSIFLTVKRLNESQGALYRFITAKLDTLEYFSLCAGTIDLGVLLALSRCTRLRGISLHWFLTGEGNIDSLLCQPHLQQHLEEMTIISKEAMTSHSFRLLAKFRNLRRVNFSGSRITTSDLQAIIEPNANHIEEIYLRDCAFISNSVLGILAHCRVLRVLSLAGTKVTDNAVEKYSREKKLGYQALRFAEEQNSHNNFGCMVHYIQSDDDSDSDRKDDESDYEGNDVTDDDYGSEIEYAESSESSDFE